MKRFLSLWLVLAIGVVLSAGMIGCGDDDDTTKPEINEFDLLAGLGDTYFGSYTTPSGAGVNITASDLYANLIDGNTANDPYIISWRSADHYALGHIEGSYNAGSVGTADIDAVIASIPAGKDVVNYCYTGQSASMVTAYMNMLGINAQNLKFGMCGWTSVSAVNLDKYENITTNDYDSWLTTVASTATETYAVPTVETGEETADAILRAYMTANFNTGFKGINVSDLYADIEVNGNADDYFIINYFADANYNAGHIPGAVQFVPKRDLASDMKLENIPTDKKVVVYCFTGQTSAQVMGYLRALGYDAYTLKFGVGAMCYDNATIATSKYTPPANDYPTVGSAS